MTPIPKRILDSGSRNFGEGPGIRYPGTRACSLSWMDQNPWPYHKKSSTPKSRRVSGTRSGSRFGPKIFLWEAL